MIVIGDKVISKNSEPFIIAEVGINHNGILENAFEMIRVAKSAGADCVKFQTFKASEFILDRTQNYSYISQGETVTESMFDMFQRCEFSEEEWKLIKCKCEVEGIEFMSTPQNKTDLDILLKLGIDAIKVGSDDFSNIPLLRDYSKTKLPLIVSMGMSDLSDVYKALSEIGSLDGYPTVLMLCTSTYPTPITDINLNKLKTLSNAFPEIILGFSDHSQGFLASSLAVSLGAKVFEKHFTLNKELPGPDHWFSEDPFSLKEWCESIRQSYQMLGSSIIRPTLEEVSMRVLARRSIVSVAEIDENQEFTEDNLGLMRPGNGIPPAMLSEFIGRKSRTKINKGKLIGWEDLL